MIILELKVKLKELEDIRKRLEKVGLLDKNDDKGVLPKSKFEDSTKDVLEIYIQDTENKLEIFYELAKKIELFQEIINKRFNYKKIEISQEKGFSLLSDKNEHLPLTKLSSGEQHELVLLYQLLFKVKPDSLILIDEPELSLHVAWQKEFLRDIQAITDLAHFDVLIATHSPQIIAD